MKSAFQTLCYLLFFPLLGLSQTISELDDNNNLLINGEPFLPIGFYCEGMPFDEFPDIAARIDSGGFNIIYTESTNGPLEEYSTFLTDCDERGLKNIIGLPYSFFDPEDFDFYAQQFLDAPSLAIWNVLDDANNFDVAEIETQLNNLSVFDESRVVLASWYSDSSPFAEMLPSVDLAGMQAYPWEDISLNDFVFVESLWRATVLECEAQGKFPIATPQAFNWGVETYPPPLHVDCQSYIGFITGMKGLIYYTFKDYDNNSTIDITQPEVYESAMQVANEVLGTELQNAFLLGEYEYGYINFYRYYATWRYEGYLYLIAVNANDELTYSYEIELPDDVVGEALNLFEYRPDSLSISNGSLVGEMTPYQVAIYRFETESLSTNTEETLDFKVYPNPSSEVQIEFVSNHFEFKVFDQSGRLLTQGQGRNGQAQIDLSELPSGIYICRVRDLESGQAATEKIVKL